jgi:hypothetical protein
MTVNRLKEKLYERSKAYWGGAEIVWGATEKVKPDTPLVVLRLGVINRPPQPITQMINGLVFSAYPSTTTLTVDLYTKGRLAEVGYYENSAENDLLDFVNYLDSISTIEWSDKNDISIQLMSGVQDLSEIINDSQWQYRAMCEFGVGFTQWAADYYGIFNESSIIFGEDGIPTDINRDNWQQTASGGGKQELADETTGSFEEITPEIEEEII